MSMNRKSLATFYAQFTWRRSTIPEAPRIKGTNYGNLLHTWFFPTFYDFSDTYVISRSYIEIVYIQLHPTLEMWLEAQKRHKGIKHPPNGPTSQSHSQSPTFVSNSTLIHLFSSRCPWPVSVVQQKHDDQTTTNNVWTKILKIPRHVP